MIGYQTPSVDHHLEMLKSHVSQQIQEKLSRRNTPQSRLSLINQILRNMTRPCTNRDSHHCGWTVDEYITTQLEYCDYDEHRAWRALWENYHDVMVYIRNTLNDMKITCQSAIREQRADNRPVPSRRRRIIVSDDDDVQEAESLLDHLQNFVPPSDEWFVDTLGIVDMHVDPVEPEPMPPSYEEAECLVAPEYVENMDMRPAAGWSYPYHWDLGRLPPLGLIWFHPNRGYGDMAYAPVPSPSLPRLRWWVLDLYFFFSKSESHAKLPLCLFCLLQTFPTAFQPMVTLRGVFACLGWGG